MLDFVERLIKQAADDPLSIAFELGVSGIVLDAIDEETALVSVSHVAFRSSYVQDVAAVGEVCEPLGVPYLVDACQAAGQLPIDPARLRCDYLGGTARKFLRGPRGIGTVRP